MDVSETELPKQEESAEHLQDEDVVELDELDLPQSGSLDEFGIPFL